MIILSAKIHLERLWIDSFIKVIIVQTFPVGVRRVGCFRELGSGETCKEAERPPPRLASCSHCSAGSRHEPGAGAGTGAVPLSPPSPHVPWGSPVRRPEPRRDSVTLSIHVTTFQL